MQKYYPFELSIVDMGSVRGTLCMPGELWGVDELKKKVKNKIYYFSG